MRALARGEKERGELGERKSGDKQSKCGGAARGLAGAGRLVPAGERGGLCSPGPFRLGISGWQGTFWLPQAISFFSVVSRGEQSTYPGGGEGVNKYNYIKLKFGPVVRR